MCSDKCHGVAILPTACSRIKIWNMNKFTGGLSVYNCHDTVWSSMEKKKNVFHHIYLH